MADDVNILKILIKVHDAMENRDYVRIKSLSNKIIEHASAHQNPDLISVAVIIYSLSKMIERESYKNEKNWDKFYGSFCKNIMDMILELKRNNVEGFRREVDENRKLINGLSGKLKLYISDVFRRARINKANMIYDQGFSMEKTAHILGVSIWELSEYTGQRIHGNENLAVTMSIQERVKIAKEIFK